MIQDLLTQARAACHAPGDLLEVHVIDGETMVQGVVHVGQFVDGWGYALGTRNELLGDGPHLGVVHEDGAYVVTL